MKRKAGERNRLREIAEELGFEVSEPDPERQRRIAEFFRQRLTIH